MYLMPAPYGMVGDGTSGLLLSPSARHEVSKEAKSTGNKLAAADSSTPPSVDSTSLTFRLSDPLTFLLSLFLAPVRWIESFQ